MSFFFNEKQKKPRWNILEYCSMTEALNPKDVQ